MKRRIPFALISVVATCLVSVSDGAAPPYSDLPVAAFHSLPKKADMPTEISAKSKAPGLFASIPKKSADRWGPTGVRYAGVFVDEDDAADYAVDKLQRWARRPKDTLIAGVSTVCFSMVDHWQLGNDEREWPQRREQWPALRSATRGSAAAKESPDYQKPRAFRVERLVLGDTKATLHLQEGWFDPVSLGAQQTAAYQVSFEEIAEGPGGIRVFGARDVKAGTVEILVYAPEHEEKLRSHLDNNMQVMRSGNHGHSDCGHARLSLRVAPGTGEHGVVQLDVLLEDKTTPPLKLDDEEVGGKTPFGGLFRREGDGPVREIRMRSLLVHAGASQALNDEAPVTTVSFGWHGASRTAQVF